MSHVRSTLASVLLLAAACGAPEAGTPPEPADPARFEPEVDLSTWASERIPLPPGFAPTLPSGDELLRFAPGMFDADSPEYWSYAFLIELEEPLTDAAAVDAFLEAYYDGLIGAVASGKGVDLGPDPAAAEVEAVAGGYAARVDLVDAFVTMEPLRLRMRIGVEGERGARLRITASPQPDDHVVWHALDVVAASLEL